MKKNYDFEYTYLRFDNLNFKLAVLQQLIFEKKVFKPEYDFGDFYEEVYQDDADYDEACEKYAQRALNYFTYLPVPTEFAKYINEINATIDDEIYYEIYPEWTGEDLFYINRISEQEVTQFPKLKSITFWYMSDCVDELIKQMRPLKIKVSTARADGKKAVSVWTSIVLIALIVIVPGALGGYIFHHRYADVEVFVHEPIVSEEEHGIFKESDDNSNGSESDFDKVEIEIQDDVEEMVKKYIEEQLDSSSIEEGAEK